MVRPRKDRYLYNARIDPATLPLLQALADNLGFVVNHPGAKFGDPSPPALLDALAAAYRRDPVAVEQALRQLGVEGGGLEEG